MTRPDQQKIDYLKALERKKFLQEHLPHLYGWKWYPWAKSFFDCTPDQNRDCMMVAANQISKSSTMIRKCIRMATDKERWKDWWPTNPNQFWYFYPTKDIATVEFDQKWIKEFLPRGEMKDDPVYGWTAEYVSKKIHALHFNSGVTVYFKSYEQGATLLQTSSVHAIFADEEMPQELYDEINVRRISPSVQGQFNTVFTATLGQPFWRETFEERGTRYERFPDAFKLNVSMYDCLTYDDGSPSPWTPEYIRQIERSCKSQAEILRRVYGRFVVDEDLKYQGFTREKNLVPKHKLPKGWLVYSGVDVGSGGRGHPAAIIFVATNKDFNKGRVFLGWRGDGIQTSAGDVLEKYKELRGTLKPVAQFYDWQSRDFLTMAQRSSPPEPFQPANKSHQLGEQLMNSLFKNGMLKIYDDPELRKLVTELENLRSSTNKSSAKDDMIDALRYAITSIPWSFEHLSREPAKQVPADKPAHRFRVYQSVPQDPDGIDVMNDELDDFQDMLDGDFYSEG